MKLYWIILVIVGCLLSRCHSEEKKEDSTAAEQVASKTIELCQYCKEDVFQKIEGQLTTATLSELRTFLHCYVPSCTWEKEPVAHALLIKAFDENLEVLLDLLAAEAPVQQDCILKMLNQPATQSLPQRNILLQLQEKKWEAVLAQQVEEALQESVAKGDEILRKLANDKSHTYQ